MSVVGMMTGRSACERAAAWQAVEKLMWHGEDSTIAYLRQVQSAWLIWFILFIWLVSFNQTNETNQINQTDQMNQTNQIDQINQSATGGQWRVVWRGDEPV